MEKGAKHFLPVGTRQDPEGFFPFAGKTLKKASFEILAEKIRLVILVDRN
jgi:hypothetical protein